MGTELLLALGLPIAYLLITTAWLLSDRVQMPGLLRRLSRRDALLWNTMVGLTIALSTLRWALADRKSTRLNSSHIPLSRMPSSA